MVIQVVKRVVAESGSEGAYIKNCVKWIVCSENSIGDPLGYVKRKLVFIRRGLIRWSFRAG